MNAMTTEPAFEYAVATHEHSDRVRILRRTGQVQNGEGVVHHQFRGDGVALRYSIHRGNQVIIHELAVNALHVKALFPAAELLLDTQQAIQLFSWWSEPVRGPRPLGVVEFEDFLDKLRHTIETAGE